MFPFPSTSAFSPSSLLPAPTPLSLLSLLYEKCQFLGTLSLMSSICGLCLLFELWQVDISHSYLTFELCLILASERQNLHTIHLEG
jgi:hypothetical protein